MSGEQAVPSAEEIAAIRIRMRDNWPTSEDGRSLLAAFDHAKDRTAYWQRLYSDASEARDAAQQRIAELETKLIIETSDRKIAQTNRRLALDRRAEDLATIARVEALADRWESISPTPFDVANARELRTALHPAVPEPAETPAPHEFTEDVNDGSMCICGIPDLTHEAAMDRLARKGGQG